MRVLVTGATGFVGQALVRRLASHEGDEVRCAIRQTRVGIEGAGRIHVVGEMDGNTNWRQSLDGVECVVHLAARVHMMQKKKRDAEAEYRRVNTDGMSALVRQAIGAGVSRFVFLSTIKVNGEGGPFGLPQSAPYRETDVPTPHDAYATSKYEAECVLRTISEGAAMEWVVIRPPLVYGPGVRANFRSLLEAVRRGYFLPFGAVRNRRSLVSLGNLVDLLVRCTRHPAAANQTFLVSDGHDMSTPELVRRLARATGRSPRLVPISPVVLSVGAKLLGRGPAIERLLGSLCVDIGKARQVLGWSPPCDIDAELWHTAHTAPAEYRPWAGTTSA